MIYINSHEPKKITDLLSQKTEIKTKNFSPGDYIVNDIAIERKTLNDFFNSFLNGRLLKQLSDLKYYYSKPVLLLENFDLYFIKKTNVFYSLLIKILFELNIKIMFSGSIEHSAEILYLLDKRNKKYRFFIPVYKNFKSNDCIEKNRISILKCIRNIGTKRAKALLAEFKTVKNIINAEEEKILSVKGIGKDTVKRLRGI